MPHAYVNFALQYHHDYALVLHVRASVKNRKTMPTDIMSICDSNSSAHNIINLLVCPFKASCSSSTLSLSLHQNANCSA